jgi:hypothetical protein
MTTPAVEHSLKDKTLFGRRDVSRETQSRFAGWGRKRSLRRSADSDRKKSLSAILKKKLNDRISF